MTTALAPTEVIGDDEAREFFNHGLMVYEGSLSMPVPQMTVALEEYNKRRRAFQAWLQEHMRRGVHYGDVPGIRKRSTNPKQWLDKPSLYKAGACLLVDLLRIRVDPQPDNETWQMLGAVPGNVCYAVALRTEEGRCISVGRGTMEKGEKSMNANSRAKIAVKRGLVDAVIMGVPCCADLFTQDLEDLEDDAPPTTRQPPANQSTPAKDGSWKLEPVTEKQLVRICSLAHDPRIAGAKRAEISKWLDSISSVNRGVANKAIYKLKKAICENVDDYEPPADEIPHPTTSDDGTCKTCGVRVMGARG